MKKRETLLLGGFLVVGAGILALGSSLRGIDYLINATESPMLQAMGAALLNPYVAAVVLMIGLVLVLKAYYMTSDEETDSKNEVGSPPNMKVLSVHVLPVDRNFQLSGPETGARAAVVRFRNEVRAKLDVGPMLATRGMLEISNGTALTHATSIWTDERSAYTNFSPGDVHDLIVAFQVEGETSIPDVLADDVRLWNISGPKSVTVKVQLVGGMGKPIVSDFMFMLHLEPAFGIEAIP
jgi:hypothetical protein